MFGKAVIVVIRLVWLYITINPGVVIFDLNIGVGRLEGAWAGMDFDIPIYFHKVSITI